MMKKLLSILIGCAAFTFTRAQVQFISKGKIEYEKKINMHKLLEGGGTWAEEMRSRIPQFRTEYYDLTFNGTTSLFKAGRESSDNIRNFWGANTRDNIIYNDYGTGKTVSQKSVWDETYLVQDSLRNIKWRITNETREIAGFNCRRATAIIMDSLFVVAFYTDEIIPTAGPESINGLPGTILGLHIPRMHTTWYATKVDVVTVNVSEIVPPTKGKKTNYTALFQAIKKGTSSWNMQDKFLWPMVL
jgi:GLPGLI family protein